jgi:hypothetical protein
MALFAEQMVAVPTRAHGHVCQQIGLSRHHHQCNAGIALVRETVMDYLGEQNIRFGEIYSRWLEPDDLSLVK